MQSVGNPVTREGCFSSSPMTSHLMHFMMSDVNTPGQYDLCQFERPLQDLTKP